jgi:hypothetical protein
VTALRSTGAIWFVPLSFALGVFVALSGDAPDTGYDAASLSTASICIVLIGPLHAGFVALRFHGFPQYSSTLRARRIGLAAVSAAWWPLLLGSPISAVAAIAVASRVAPRDRQGLSVLLVVFATVFACGLFGLALSWVLPVVLAIPACATVTYLWLAMPGAGSDALLRNLNSSFVGCCAPETQPATGMVLGSLTLVLLVALGVVLALMPRQWARAPRILIGSVVAATIAFGFTMAVSVVHSAGTLSLLAVEPRTTALACSTETGVRTCLWPENEHRSAEVMAIAQEMDRTLAGWGLSPAEEVTEAKPDRPSVTFTAVGYARHADVQYSMAAGYVDLAAGCVGSAGQAPAAALAAIAAGLSESQVAGRLGSEPAKEAASVIANAGTADDVRQWFAGHLPSPVICNEEGG